LRLLKKQEIEKEYLPGRIIQKAVGKDGISTSSKMTVGFARYSEESGPMEPHHHAEETVVVLEAEKAWVRYGDDRDSLSGRIKLENGMILHFEELEWHVFGYDKGGYVEIIFIYGQVNSIRPEEIIR
jgi:hypothetical protein